MAKKKQQRKRAATPAADDEELDADGFAELMAPMQALVEQQKKIYVEHHEYRDAKPADFKGRDKNWYDAATKQLTALGYRALGDFVDETLAQSMGVVAVVRRFVSADGTDAVAVYHFVHRMLDVKMNLRICDIDTEFSDASFLGTSNSEASAAASLPPQIRATKLPEETPITELVERHQKSKREFLKKNPKLTATVIRTAEEYDAAQHRQDAIKAAFRQGIGYLDPAEVRRVAEQSDPEDPLGADLSAVTADLARRQAQLQEKVPAVADLMSSLMGGGKEKSLGDLAKLAAAAILQEQSADVPTDKQEEITAAMTELFSAAGSGDEKAGMTNLFTMMAKLQDLEPEEQKQKKEDDFAKMAAKAEAEYERQQAAHAKKRLAKGLSKKAGTGKPEPEILIHSLPVGDIDYKDKPGRTLTGMVNEIKASKKRRDTKVLAKLPIGHSRVGGLPDLPPGVAWPKFKGKRIPFVAQISLEQFPTDAHPLLPERGHLYAFALISNEEGHWPPPCSVFLHDGDAESLVRAPFPKDDEIWEDWAGERVYEILPATGNKPKSRGKKKPSRDDDDTLGWLQGEMADYFGTAGEIADAQFGDGNDWINLLALYSMGSMEWSDSGHLYLLIRRSALKKRDFSNVIAAACSS